MLREATDTLLAITLDIFNDILRLPGRPPEQWRKSIIKVIYKKGDRLLPQNYRPISIIPVLYKLFSRLLCNRLAPYISRQQGVEQAAYRKGYSTEDHLVTASVLIEKCREYNQPLWIATVDCQKAFDTVSHTKLWEVLKKQGVPTQYVMLLQGLYAGQAAKVTVDVPSREFSVLRGVKQGDPVSGLLFVSIMQDLFGDLQQKWFKLSQRRKNHPIGICLGAGHGRPLTDLHFADDVLLVAQSRTDIKKMLTHVTQEAQTYGLTLNFEKTEVLTWDHLRQNCRQLWLGENSVDILGQDAAEKYLGRKLALEDTYRVELENRISAAWAAFHTHKQELCCRHYRLKDRCRLFEATVTPTLLYGCAAWALTQQMERRLRTQRRRMLRYLFCLHRRSEETWVEYIQRSARECDQLAEEYGMKPWITEYPSRKWQFARRLARHDDERWSSLIISWLPNNEVGRAPGRPRTGWAKDFEMFAGGSWLDMAKDKDLWNDAGHLFASCSQF